MECRRGAGSVRLRVFLMGHKVFPAENGALFIEYRAAFMEYRALSGESKVFFKGCRTLLVEFMKTVMKRVMQRVTKRAVYFTMYIVEYMKVCVCRYIKHCIATKIQT